MTAEWADHPPRLVVSFYLGEPAEERRTEVYELLLTLNQMSVETAGGIRGALSPDGELTLVYDLHIDQLTEVELREALLNCAALGRRWRKMIEIQAEGSMSLSAMEMQRP